MLIATAFGLYYLGSEAVRLCASNIHVAFELDIPLPFLAHIKTGWKRT
jgi:hypothetical protein